MRKLYVVSNKKEFPVSYRMMLKDIPLIERIFGKCIIIQDVTFNTLNDIAFALSRFENHIPQFSKYGLYYFGKELSNIVINGDFTDYVNLDIEGRNDIVTEIIELVKSSGVKINPMSFSSCVKLAKKVNRMCHTYSGEVFDDTAEMFEIYEYEYEKIDEEGVKIYVPKKC